MAGHIPSSFISVSSSKHSSTQEGKTICFLFGLLIRFGRMMEIMDLLRCPARELGIAPGIIIIHDNMGQFGIIQVRSDDPSILG